MHSRSILQDKGFTLVELAIALVVIGLLIGGVLKGQELIENAKISSIIRNIKSYDSAAMIFRNTYGALPGDIKNPGLRLPNCTTSLCSLSGNDNGRLEYGTSMSLAQEVYNFFPHLVKAGLLKVDIPGHTNTTVTLDNADLVFPKTPYKHHIAAEYWTGIYSANQYKIPAIVVDETESLPTHVLMGIDMKIDDGKPTTGNTYIVEVGVCPFNCPAGQACEYDLQAENKGCWLMMKSDF